MVFHLYVFVSSFLTINYCYYYYLVMSLILHQMLPCSLSVRLVLLPAEAVRQNTRAQLSLGLADRTHGAHSQPASITVRV